MNQADPTFDAGSYWKMLDADGEVIDETRNMVIDGVEFHAPTVPEGESTADYAKKQNYLLQFDRDVFTGRAKKPMLSPEGRILYNRNTQEVRYSVHPFTESIPDIDWCKENKLDLTSHPAEWFQAFLPIRNKQGDNQGSMKCSIQNLMSWTNTKAHMQSAGLGTGTYDDFKNFELNEFMRHIALYLFQGLSPSPQVEMKFRSSADDPVNGNNFIHRAFGCKHSIAVRRHKHFKAFFACVDPTFPVPSRDSHPNWKVHPLLKHIMKVSKAAIRVGQNISCDEQTIGFQGHHWDKQQITYKAEGDGFLADCICTDGYTYSFYFCHQPPPTVFPDMSPLHSRVLSLISQLPDKNYNLGMDNLYNSAKLARAAKAMEQRVNTHGVVRVSGRGVPKCVIQAEVTRKQDLEKVRHTVRAAVVKGDSVCTNLVCISLYDTKPVYILTNCCSEIKWIKKKKKVWHKERGAYVELIFYRLNIIDFYNFNMGDVDRADQLRNYYRYDTQWHRNRKWWWAMWWWGFQLLLTNAYVAYVKYHELHKSKDYMGHYDFIRSVALAWIDPQQYWPNKRKRRVRISMNVEEEEIGRVSRTRRQRTGSSRSISSSNSSISSNSTMSSISSSSQHSAMKCERVNDKSLNPMSGSLRGRLNSFVHHHPHLDGKKRRKCQLHRWAKGRDAKEVRGMKVGYCERCNVNLCLDGCWKLFHECENVNDLRAAITGSPEIEK